MWHHGEQAHSFEPVRGKFGNTGCSRFAEKDLGAIRLNTSHQYTLAVMETDCILGFTDKIVDSRSKEYMVALNLAVNGTTPGALCPVMGFQLQQRHGHNGSH